MATPPSSGPDPVAAVASAVFDIVSQIPPPRERPASDPARRADEIIHIAALKAAAVSGTLALPPGPLGALTILPDLYAVWRLQAQMVADIAAVYGKTALLTEREMIYCLFRHAAAQVFRDLVSRVGERLVFRAVSLPVLRGLARRVGIKVSEQVLRKALSRWVPLVGAATVAGYAAWDTSRVGQTTIELFSSALDARPPL